MVDVTVLEIETERLRLIPVHKKYASQMLEELTDEITRYMSIYPPKTIDEEIAYITDSLERMKKGTDLSLVILDKTTNEYLGGAGIRGVDTKTPELGIWVKKSAHGKKIGREAVTGLKKWIDEHRNIDYLIYPVDKSNIASRKIAESLGGKVVSQGIREFPSGKKLDEVVYHIPKEENGKKLF